MRESSRLRGEIANRSTAMSPCRLTCTRVLALMPDFFKFQTISGVSALNWRLARILVVQSQAMIDSQTTRRSLLLRIRNERDADSWSQFVTAYAPLVQGFLRRRGLQDADASDLTQEVLARVATAIKGFEYDPDKGSFRGWLFTIVENCHRRFAARERPGQRGSGDARIHHELTQHAARDWEEEWERQYQRHLLQRAADDVRCDFQPATWRAFWETAVEGRAAKDVAAELRMSIASVYMAKHRITGRLRQHIQYLDGEMS